jgi:uncharacterized membrane protein HdeD (DUF308 family)
MTRFDAGEHPSRAVCSPIVSSVSSRLTQGGDTIIIFGIILLIIGFVAKVSILWSIGILLLIVGLILALLGTMGRAVGGRRHYY